MALIENINVSSPNDGLGDALRSSQVKANSNFTELNNKKVEKILGKDLSSNDFTDILKAKLDGIADNAGNTPSTDHLLLANIGVQTHDQIDEHIADFNNPHDVTKLQLGLGNVDDTADLDKPISVLIENALDLKENSTNKSTTMTGNESSNIFFLTARAVYDWAVGFFEEAPFDITYIDLFNLQNSGTLKKGRTYRLIDYMTTYIQPVTLANKTSGIFEVLHIKALNGYTLENQCKSELYPQDVVYYDITDNTEGFTKGKIYRRHDTMNNNNVGTDWRHIYYHRDASDFIFFSNFPLPTGDYLLFKSGFNYNSPYVNNNYIAGRNLYNTVICGRAIGNHITGFFIGNTIGLDITVDSFFNYNYISYAFQSNKVANFFNCKVQTNLYLYEQRDTYNESFLEHIETKTIQATNLPDANGDSTFNKTIVSKTDGTFGIEDKNYWSTNGNAGTNIANNFIGTTDNQPIRIRINNLWNGSIGALSTFLGGDSGQVNTGNFNLGLGHRSLRLNTTGTYNTAVGGTECMDICTTGSGNTAVGAFSLRQNNTASNNTAVGYGALGTINETSNSNTATGFNALNQLVTGINNIGIGQDSLGSIISGNNNIGIGTGASVTNALNNQINIGNFLYKDSVGNFGVNTTAPTSPLDVNGNTVRVRDSRTIATATSTGIQGEVCWDANFLYACVASNTWKRTALTTW